MNRSLRQAATCPSSRTRSSASSAAAAPARTTCCAWRSGAGSSTGPARASTTSSRSGSPGSATSTRGRSRARRASARSTRSRRKGLDALRDYARDAGRVHAGQERATPPPADRGPRRRGGDARRPSRSPRRHRRPARPSRAGGAHSAEKLPHRRKYLLLVIDFLRRLLDLHDELVDEVERELAPPDLSGLAAGRP